LASLAARGEAAAESFQIDDTSIDWLTSQVNRLFMPSTIYGAMLALLLQTKHFVSCGQQLI
jgi:hypothetical protein